LIRVLELLSTEGFDVGVVLFSVGRLFIGYEILPADEKHWRLIVLAGNLIQVGFFPRNSANSRDNDAYGRNAKLDDFSGVVKSSSDRSSEPKPNSSRAARILLAFSRAGLTNRSISPVKRGAP